MGRKRKIRTLEQVFWEFIGYKLGEAFEGPSSDTMTFPEYATYHYGFDKKEAEKFYNEYEPE